jgi:triacylglycerol lipase
MANPPRGSLPMLLPVAPFALSDAVACGKLVNIAYQQYAQWIKQGCPSSANFRWRTPTGHFYYSVPLFWTDDLDYDEPIGFVAVNTQSNDAYLVFRGTMSDSEEVADLWTDQVPYAFAPGYGQVHSGFHGIYQQLQPQVATAIAAAISSVAPLQRFFFTGHSLGSGLSSLAVGDVINNVPLPAIPRLHYNFASPRVGDPQFAYTMNNNGVPTYRVVNTEDVIPDLPAAIWLTEFGDTLLFKHVGTPVDFTAQYDTDGNNHSLNIAYQYAVSHPNNPEGPLPTRMIGMARLPGVRLDANGDVMQLPEVG